MRTSASHRAHPRLTALATCMLVALAGSVDPVHAAVAGPTASAQQRARSNRKPGVEQPSNAQAFARNRSHAPLPSNRPARTSDFVLNCDDDGSGSLRNVLAGASDGEIINLAALSCSTITLTTGPLTTAALDVTLQGPGADLLAIDGNANGRVIDAGGSLTINDLTIRNGVDVAGYGGCVRVAANLTMTSTRVTGCTAGDGTNTLAFGGAIDALGNAILTASTVSGNNAIAANGAFGGGVYSGGYGYSIGGSVSNNTAEADGGARGGGMFARNVALAYLGAVVSGNRATAENGVAYGGGLMAYEGTAGAFFSTISGNTAHSGTKWSYGGGVQAGDVAGGATGDALFIISTVSGNAATADCVGCFIQGGGAHAFGNVIGKYSTFSDNHVTSLAGNGGVARGGGMATFANAPDGTIQLLESTVSGNSATGGFDGTYGYGYGGGAAAIEADVVAQNSTIAFNAASEFGGGFTGQFASPSTLVSTIVTNNTAPTNPDVATNPFAPGAWIMLGDHNLILTASSDATYPADTIASDPHLLPLANNGGSTWTHALGACSPAINAGSNPAPFANDQRGEGYAREAAGAPDIGALETQDAPADRIFADSFEENVICT